jgi:hypothetical protein
VEEVAALPSRFDEGAAEHVLSYSKDRPTVHRHRVDKIEQTVYVDVDDVRYQITKVSPEDEDGD